MDLLMTKFYIPRHKRYYVWHTRLGHLGHLLQSVAEDEPRTPDEKQRRKQRHKILRNKLLRVLNQ
jgi:hypothetical protein